MSLFPVSLSDSFADALAVFPSLARSPVGNARSRKSHPKLVSVSALIISCTSFSVSFRLSRFVDTKLCLLCIW